jgi:hypothetical protein
MNVAENRRNENGPIKHNPKGFSFCIDMSYEEGDTRFLLRSRVWIMFLRSRTKFMSGLESVLSRPRIGHIRAKRRPRIGRISQRRGYGCQG